MAMRLSIEDVWSVDEQGFNALALQLFQQQAKNNPVYAEFLTLIDKKPEEIHEVDQVPYLPINLFKNHIVLSNAQHELVFESSSTSGQGISRHYMASGRSYLENCTRIFEAQFGPLEQFEILGLLPSYMERKHSSLVYMVEHFIKKSGTREPHHFLYDHERLTQRINASERPVLLFGVSFALLDFAAEHCILRSDLYVIETGGMKGRKEELLKTEVYENIARGFPHAKIHSEYGMTELSSQAYTQVKGIYHPPPWMRVTARLDNDPLSSPQFMKRGGLNIIDLANVHSCAFIATDDLGLVHEDGSFEVLGRLDQADLRGCSLLVS